MLSLSLSSSLSDSKSPLYWYFNEVSHLILQRFMILVIVVVVVVVVVVVIIMVVVIVVIILVVKDYGLQVLAKIPGPYQIPDLRE